jgi:hypothetical protein
MARPESPLVVCVPGRDTEPASWFVIVGAWSSQAYATRREAGAEARRLEARRQRHPGIKAAQ